jgi:hypothetical protein
MPRRARSAPRSGWLFAALGLVLVLVAVGGYFFGSSDQPYRAAPEFPVEQYLEESTTMRGNTYRLTGAVLNALAWSPNEGRLISVQPTGSNSPIPLLIPANLGVPNIQKGQRFHFLLEVRESGVLYATDLTKS